MYTYEKWLDLERKAQEYMKDRETSGSGWLIEVAAQHPLVCGIYPGLEFRKRLELAVEISDSKSMFYVPGSLHRGDKISLGEAGKRYLEYLGIDSDRIITLPDVEVYNSTAECEQASKLFKTGDYSQLHCVCGSAQEMRKALSYIQFECLPYFHTVSMEEMYHSYVEEVFRNIPILLSGDTDGEFERLRKERAAI